MANYENIKRAISDVIKKNGNQEITGNVLQSVLLSMINNIGANATFSGVATPTTAPGTPDQLVFYIAGQPGTYANFGGAKLNNGELAVFSNQNGAWKTEKITLSSSYSRSYDAEKILALTTSSSSDDIKAAFTPIGGSEVDLPKLGDYIIWQSQQTSMDKPESVVIESTETDLKSRRIAFLANGINYAITVISFIGGTYRILSILRAKIGADTDTANASGSVYGRIAKNAEDIKNLQDEQRAVYNANLITALNVGSSVEQALTVNGEYRQPISGDVLLSDTENGVFVSSNSFQTKVTFVYQIGTDIVTVVFNKQTKRVTSISTSSVGSPDDAADKDGSAFARIAQNAEDVKALQDEPSLHDLWLNAGATYQVETNTYTLNGVSGLTKNDMLVSWRETNNMLLIGRQKYRYQSIRCKTNFLAIGPNGSAGQAEWMYIEENDFTYCFYLADNLLTLRVCGTDTLDRPYGMCIPKIAYGMFYACSARNILGIIQMNKCTDVTNMFFNNTNIENIKLYKVKQSISFLHAPNLTVEDNVTSTLGFLVTYADNTSPITITLHADVFARVPETLIQKAQAKQISIVSA